MDVNVEQILPDLDRMRMMVTPDGRLSTFILPKAPYTADRLKMTLRAHEETIVKQTRGRHQELIDAARRVVEAYLNSDTVNPFPENRDLWCAMEDMRKLLARES